MDQKEKRVLLEMRKIVHQLLFEGAAEVEFDQTLITIAAFPPTFVGTAKDGSQRSAVDPRIEADDLDPDRTYIKIVGYNRSVTRSHKEVASSVSKDIVHNDSQYRITKSEKTGKIEVERGSLVVPGSFDPSGLDVETVDPESWVKEAKYANEEAFEVSNPELYKAWSMWKDAGKYNIQNLPDTEQIYGDAYPKKILKKKGSKVTPWTLFMPWFLHQLSEAGLDPQRVAGFGPRFDSPASKYVDINGQIVPGMGQDPEKTSKEIEQLYQNWYAQNKQHYNLNEVLAQELNKQRFVPEMANGKIVNLPEGYDWMVGSEPGTSDPRDVVFVRNAIEDPASIAYFPIKSVESAAYQSSKIARSKQQKKKEDREQIWKPVPKRPGRQRLRNKLASETANFYFGQDIGRETATAVDPITNRRHPSVPPIATFMLDEYQGDMPSGVRVYQGQEGGKADLDNIRYVRGGFQEKGKKGEAQVGRYSRRAIRHLLSALGRFSQKQLKAGDLIKGVSVTTLRGDKEVKSYKLWRQLDTGNQDIDQYDWIDVGSKVDLIEALSGLKTKHQDKYLLKVYREYTHKERDRLKHEIEYLTQREADAIEKAKTEDNPSLKAAAVKAQKALSRQIVQKKELYSEMTAESGRLIIIPMTVQSGMGSEVSRDVLLSIKNIGNDLDEIASNLQGFFEKIDTPGYFNLERTPSIRGLTRKLEPSYTFDVKYKVKEYGLTPEQIQKAARETKAVQKDLINEWDQVVRDLHRYLKDHKQFYNLLTVERALVKFLENQELPPAEIGNSIYTGPILPREGPIAEIGQTVPITMAGDKWITRFPRKDDLVFTLKKLKDNIQQRMKEEGREKPSADEIQEFEELKQAWFAEKVMKFIKVQRNRIFQILGKNIGVYSEQVDAEEWEGIVGHYHNKYGLMPEHGEIPLNLVEEALLYAIWKKLPERTRDRIGTSEFEDFQQSFHSGLSGYTAALNDPKLISFLDQEDMMELLDDIKSGHLQRLPPKIKHYLGVRFNVTEGRMGFITNVTRAAAALTSEDFRRALIGLTDANGAWRSLVRKATQMCMLNPRQCPLPDDPQHAWALVDLALSDYVNKELLDQDRRKALMKKIPRSSRRDYRGIGIEEDDFTFDWAISTPTERMMAQVSVMELLNDQDKLLKVVRSFDYEVNNETYNTALADVAEAGDEYDEILRSIERDDSDKGGVEPEREEVSSDVTPEEAEIMAEIERLSKEGGSPEEIEKLTSKLIKLGEVGQAAPLSDIVRGGKEISMSQMDDEDIFGADDMDERYY